MKMSETSLRFLKDLRGRAGLQHGLSAPVLALSLIALPLLSACARQTAETVSHAPDAPGFLMGLWHGFVFPVAWVISLFDPAVAIYAVPNNGGWYDFGYFVGIVFFGVGARKTQTVTKTVYVGRWGGRGTVIDQ